MKGHGGGLTKRRAIPWQPPAARARIAGTPPGFRHFDIGNPLAPRFTLGGVDPRSGPEARATLEDVMFRLHTRMANWDIAWPPAGTSPNTDPKFAAAPPPLPADNPYVPSGYTYLLQLIAHDMVLTPVPFWAVDDLAAETSNQRANRLRLDALYGDGPMGLPNIYAPDSKSDFSRTRLQLARAGRVAGPPAVCPFRDIARLALRDTLLDLPGETEPLVADPRNDDHAIISQLTVLFHLLHNAFVNLQPAVADNEYLPDFVQQTSANFLRAREATTLVYRFIVRNDVMRRVLNPLVHAHYNTPGAAFLDAQSGVRGSAMPLEFSHGAFRFAHVLVRRVYQVNDGPGRDQLLSQALAATSARSPAMAPLAEKWLVKWSNYFAMPGLSGATLNLSQRIGPAVPVPMMAAPVDQRIGTTPGAGVMYRDLVSAGLAGLWRVDALIAALRASPAHAAIVAQSPHLSATPAQRAAAIRGWLDAQPAPWTGAAGAAALGMLADDPPLPFFVLFEAMQDPAAKGCRLGALGSILVAEMIFGELERNPLDSEHGGRGLATQLTRISPKFDDPAFATMTTMADVVGFVWDSLKKTGDAAMTTPPLV